MLELNVNMLGTGQDELNECKHMYLPVSVKGTRVVTLLDTGASGSAFVSSSFAHRLSLPMFELPKPIRLRNFQGQLVESMNRASRFPITIGKSKETVTAFVLKNIKHDLVLGLPWFEKYNPKVDWGRRTLEFHHHPTKIPYYNSRTEASDTTVISRKPLSPNRYDTTAKPTTRELRQGNVSSGSLSSLPNAYKDFADVFSQDLANKLPPHRPWDHAIDLQSDKQPPSHRPYCMNVKELEALRNYLDEELAKGFIRVSRSPAAAPVLFVKKANGDLRFCVDYRGLNAITIKNKYSLPLVQETLNQLATARYYTKIDIRSAFNKLRIKKGDEWKTAFTTRYGLYEYLVMPFGMCNAPSSFQTYINQALKGYLDIFCTAYVDDILIYSDTKEQHQLHVRMVLQRLREFGLQADINKCEFEKLSVKYLGLIISTSGIKMDPAKIECVQQWPIPRSVRDIQTFLGFANFYRRFIPAFSRLANPLTALTKKDQTFKWSATCESAFMGIKEAFSNGPILAHFDPERKTILETDASDFVTAAVLSQYDERDVLRPVAFMSKKMLPAECNYEIFDKELLAIVKAYETWNAELSSVKGRTSIITDHKSLEYFTTSKKLNRRQARWSEFLAGFDFQILFRPGRLGGKPDALTRISADIPQNNEDPREKYQNQTLIKPSQCLRSADSDRSQPEDIDENWATACAKDDFCQDVRRALKNNSKYHGKIQLSDCELTIHSFKFNNKKYVPEARRLDTLHHFHENQMYGHRGAAALNELISRTYWWPHLHKDTTKYARGCESCQRNNPSTQKPYGWLRPLEAPQHAFRHLTLDYVGPLPACKIRGFEYRYILQVVDRLTKRIWVIATETMTARETAAALLANVFRFSGLPDSLTSDQGRSFIDTTWRMICEELKIAHRLSSSYHPQTDGQTERANKTLEVYLRHYVQYSQDDWAKHLPIAEFCINNHVNASTGVTPFFASFGHHPRMDFKPESERPRERPEFVETICKIQQNCTKAIIIAQQFQSGYANKKRLPAPRYQIGDLVYLSLKNISCARPSKKLDSVRAGPFKITAMKGSLVAKLDLPVSLSGIDNNFHVSLLSPAHSGFHSQHQARPPPVELGVDDDGDSYEVEEILDSRYHRGNRQYLVKWTGYNDPTWQPEGDLDNCKDLLNDFISRLRTNKS